MRSIRVLKRDVPAERIPERQVQEQRVSNDPGSKPGKPFQGPLILKSREPRARVLLWGSGALASSTGAASGISEVYVP